MSAEVEAATANPTMNESETVEATKSETIESSKSNTVEDTKSEPAGTLVEGVKINNDEKREQANGESTKEGNTAKERHENNEKDNRGRRDGKNGDDSYRSKRNYKANIKSKYDDTPTDDPVLIRKQVEFYLSDSNLQSDKYMFSQVEGAENKPVDIKTLHGFKRMQRFTPYSAVVKALKDSEVLEVVNGDDAGREQVRRKTPLPVDIGTDFKMVEINFQRDSDTRCIYAKGFGEEKSSTQVDVEKLFAPYGSRSVRLRRAYDQTFKGSAFVEFESKEAMQEFLELEEKPTWDDKPLKIMSKIQYMEGKRDEINAGKIRPNDADERPERRRYDGGGRGRGRGRGQGRGGRGGRGGHRENRDRDRPSHRDLQKNDWKDLAKKEQPKSKQEYDDDGIPKVMSSAPAAEAKETPEATNGNKRAREDDGVEDGSEAKKGKTKVATDAS